MFYYYWCWSSIVPTLGFKLYHRSVCMYRKIQSIHRVQCHPTFRARISVLVGSPADKGGSGLFESPESGLQGPEVIRQDPEDTALSVWCQGGGSHDVPWLRFSKERNVPRFPPVTHIWTQWCFITDKGLNAAREGRHRIVKFCLRISLPAQPCPHRCSRPPTVLTRALFPADTGRGTAPRGWAAPVHMSSAPSSSSWWFLPCGLSVPLIPPSSPSLSSLGFIS